MPNRLPEVQAAYDEFKRSYAGTCKLCDLVRSKDDPQVIARHIHFIVIKNHYPYAVWDDLPVQRHLMIVPNRHIMKLNELTPEERTEYVRLLGEYEDAGYSMYSRAARNTARSIGHQHTHFIDVGT